MMEEEGKYDELFAHVAGASGGLEPLLKAFFGFLHRKTDFYVEFIAEKGKSYTMGFPVGEAEKLLLRSFRHYPFKSLTGEKLSEKSSTDNSNFKKEVEQRKNISLEKANVTNEVDSTKRNSSAVAASEKPKGNESTGGKQIPVGNGGIGPNYYWTQSLKDLTVYVSVESGTRGKDVKCTINPKRISLSIKNEVLLEGPLDDNVKTDDSLWTLANSSETNSSQIVIILEKCRMTWWKSVIEGHPEIDTSKVYQMLS